MAVPNYCRSRGMTWTVPVSSSWCDGACDIAGPCPSKSGYSRKNQLPTSTTEAKMTSPPQPPPRPEPKEEFTRSLKGANVDGYIFETMEDDRQSVTSLTNSVVRSLIKLDGNTNNVVLRYTSVKDKGSQATKTYKTEVSRA